MDFFHSPRIESDGRWRVKLGVAGSVVLGGAALILAVFAPWGRDGTRSIDPELVVSLVDRFTSPYYCKKGGCPEGDVITDEDDCYEAFESIFPSRKGTNKKTGGGNNPGCLVNKPAGAYFNPRVKGTQFSTREYICKKSDDLMPDFEELQGDMDKLSFHCLKAAYNFELYKECVLQITRWNKDNAVEEEQQEAGESPSPADEAAVAEVDECWTKHADKFSGGFANGENGNFDLDGAKKKCITLSECSAVTCSPKLDKCTVRKGANLGESPSGEVSFTPDC